MRCYCDSGLNFNKCCEPFLSGTTFPSTAEALMRSRFSAYATGNVDYVLATHTPKGRDELDPDATRSWAEKADFTDLTIIETHAGTPRDETGIVEFAASYTMNNKDYEHHEIARFEKIDDRWYFVEGEEPKRESVRRETPKVGRNDPCICGSGKKFKKCCGAA